MTTKNTPINRLLSILLCVALLVAYLPAGLMANAVTPDTRVADPSTMDGWKNYFLPTNGDLSTENAGGIWTDKSVFTNADAFAGTGITMDGTNSFLVALSAIASNKTVTGMSSVPIDTMLVLDVSGSMNDNWNNNDVAEELVEAANESIAALLSTNANSRVGVVLYSGTSADPTNDNAAVLLLPMDRYKTGLDGKYLSYRCVGDRSTTEYIELSENIYIEGKPNEPIKNDVDSKEVVGATYIQKGIIKAMNEFKKQTSVTVQDPTLGTVKRKPVIVLMSDGAPTLASNHYTNPGQYTIGDGTTNGVTSGIGFLSQLSAAYAKQQIEAKYESDALFYTLGLGIDNNTIATSVMNPKSHASSAIDTYWKRFLAVDGYTTIQVDGEDVAKSSVLLEQEYVDRYFSVSSGSNLAQGLKDAFKEIVGAIQLQAKYFPTLVTENEDLSGYVSFVDRIGPYMNVTDIKGLLIHNTLFSGADIASNFVEGGGSLGTIQTPTALGDELVWSIMERLNLKTADEARTLIALAYQNGQLAYTDKNNYSNYIGWYSNANDEYLGFWHEGITTMPDPNDPTLTDATRPAYINKSYFYLGEVDEAQGVTKSDMMYATVRVREEIATGEQSVAFAVPAALIPVVTMNVTLDETGKLSKLETAGAQHPFRLVYEVALDEAINEYSLKGLVSQDYLDKNTNPNGSVNFYTNQYEVDNSTGYGKVNSYSYFTPSRQNERFYYQNDAQVYVDTNGTPYTHATAQPDGVKYRRYTVYQKVGTSYTTETVYRRLSDDALATALRNTADNTWYIPKGNIHVNMDGFVAYKGGLGSYDAVQNLTDTLIYAANPFVDTDGHKVNDLNHNFLVGITLGNNGRMSVTPATGIKLTKELSADATVTTQPFVFQLTNVSNANDNTAYPAQVVSAAGTATNMVVTFVNGKATVSLKAGETLYIADMTAGQIIRVEEVETADYKVQTVNGAAGNAVDLTLVANSYVNAAYVNADRGDGNLTVSKVVEHDLGAGIQAPADKKFQMQVTLSGVGTANTTFVATHTDMAGVITNTSVTTDANGRFQVLLAHDEQLEIHDLPVGTVATVVEVNPSAGFAPAYWENGATGDGIVTIENARTVSVIVVNDYTPNRVYPVNISMVGSKTLTGRDWLATDKFEFELQRLTAPDTWTVKQTATVDAATLGFTPVNGQAVAFNFNNAFANAEYTVAGTYYYRVVEKAQADAKGMVFDKTVHAFAVDVGDLNWDGQLEITGVRSMREGTTLVTQPTANQWNVQMAFNNVYAIDDNAQAQVTIDLNKTVVNPTGSPLATLAGFQFGLYNADGTLAFQSQPTTDRGFARLVLSYTKADLAGADEKEFAYTLKEIVPNPVPAGWTYSNVEIPVTVVLKDDKDGTISAVIYTGNTATTDTAITASFENTYDPTDASLTIDFVQKTLSGRDMIAGEFTFAVYASSDTSRQNALSEGKNDVNGKVIFDKALTFDKVGVYYFDVIETTADGKGVTTDKNTYRVTVTVTDGGDGKLAASYVLVNAEGNQIVFNNRYTTTSASVTVSGTKILRGRTLINDEFKFVLSAASLVGGQIVKGAAISEARNLSDSSFSFPAIEYTAAGTYYYVVSEEKNGLADFGIVYDEREFVITVTVTDDGEGALHASWSSAYLNGSTGPVIFINDYIPAPTNTQITGNKVLEGKILSGGTYSFKLFASDSTWAEVAELETVPNADDGSISFAAITYDKVGEYYYLVKEVNGGQTIDGVTYDDTVYRVRIEVTDNLRGQLNTKIYITDQDNNPCDDVTFINIYQISGTDSVELSGKKTLTGRDLKLGEFTFELFETLDDQFQIAEGQKALLTATNLADGSFSFKLDYDKDDVGKTFYYVVLERNDGKFGITYSKAEYQISVKVEDDLKGGVKTTTVINEGQTNLLAFENSYTAQASASISVDKTVDNVGFDKITAEGFRFELENMDTHEKEILTTNAAGAAVIDKQFTQADLGKTFTYKLTELNDGKKHVTYSDAVYEIKLTVALDADDKLTIQKTVNSLAVAEVVAEFTNTYDYTPDPGTVEIPISVKKLVENLGFNKIGPEGFRFELENVDTREKQVLTTDANGDASVTLTFKKADVGKNIYTLKELNDGKANVGYSEKVYNIVIDVSANSNNELVASIQVDGKAANEVVAEFTNTYDYTPDPGTVEIPISVKKLVENLGFNKIGPEGFRFELENVDTREKQVLTTDANGDASVTLTFKKADVGKNIYTLKELNDGKANVGYSEKVYNIVIDVSVNSNNELVASIQVDGKAANEVMAEFTNTYDFTPDPDAIHVGVEVNKEVINKGTAKIGPENFEFVLKNVATGEEVKVKTNATGFAAFDLEFQGADAGKIHTYELKEVNDGRANVTYSDKVYTIEVKVSVDADNKLVAELKLDEAPVEKLAATFQNTYDYTPGNNNPNTGDSYLSLWLSLLFVSGGCFTALSFFGKKKEQF